MVVVERCCDGVSPGRLMIVAGQDELREDVSFASLIRGCEVDVVPSPLSSLSVLILSDQRHPPLFKVFTISPAPPLAYK